MAFSYTSSKMLPARMHCLRSSLYAGRTAIATTARRLTMTAMRWNDAGNARNAVEESTKNDQLNNILKIMKESEAEKSSDNSLYGGGRQERSLGGSMGDFMNLDQVIATVGSNEQHKLYIHASENNTILNLTSPDGKTLVQTSGGTAGFKKSARSGYEAAHQAALQLLEKKKAKNLQIKYLHVIMKGFGAGREAAYKALVTGDWNIKRVTDATPVAFGGCRPKKARRL